MSFSHFHSLFNFDHHLDQPENLITVMSKRPPRVPSPNTPYRWQDYINVDWTGDPVYERIRAAAETMPHWDGELPSSDSDSYFEEDGILTPRSISSDRPMTVMPPSTIDPDPIAPVEPSEYSSNTTSQATPQITPSAQRQRSKHAARQYRRPLTRSCRTIELVSLSYDSAKAVNIHRWGRKMWMFSDELLELIVGWPSL